MPSAMQPVGGQPAGVHRTVWLLRHAKAVSEPAPGQRDRDRPLTRRGERDATALGAALASQAAGEAELPDAPRPEVVLCSSAVRTVQTAERVVARLSPPPEVHHLQALYNADPDDVVDQLRLLEDEVTSVMVVGHNPTTQWLGTAFLAPGQAGETGGEELPVPTAGLVVLSVTLPRWSELTLGSATLLAHTAPPY